MPLANAILMIVSIGFALAIPAWRGRPTRKIVAAARLFPGSLDDKVGK
jgi:hypothetical protein